jgi:quinol monooxygenase YgiN
MRALKLAGREQSRDHALRYDRDMLIVTGSIECRPDTIDRILELGLAHVQRSRLEPGCILHSIHRDVENELRIVFIEQWEDANALEDHFHVPASGEFVREAAALTLRQPEMSIFEVEVASMRNPAVEKRRS